MQFVRGWVPFAGALAPDLASLGVKVPPPPPPASSPSGQAVALRQDASASDEDLFLAQNQGLLGPSPVEAAKDRGKALHSGVKRMPMPVQLLLVLVVLILAIGLLLLGPIMLDLVFFEVKRGALLVSLVLLAVLGAVLPRFL
jgi:hypothetical protein